MKLVVIANRVYRHGGMERASAEVFSRIACTDDVTIIATECEIANGHLTWLPVRPFGRPAMLSQALFARSAKALEREGTYDLSVSVDSAARDADVVIAHFCLGMFASRFAGLRGGRSRIRRLYQRVAERSLAARERGLYRSSRLRGVIAVSSGLKRELIEQYGIEESKIRVIPNGVDRTVFHPAASLEAKLALRRELGLKEEGFLAVFVGGDWDRKGLADVIRAIAKLPETELVVVGGGNATAFGRLADEVGAGKRVHFAGIQAQPQRYLAAGDVFACPSRYETFSMSALEAAACGLPLIVVRTNGLEDFVEHGVNGFFVEPTTEAVREALERVIGDPVMRASMSQAAVRTAEQFDWGDIAAATREVLETLSREPAR
ncbi:MAG TPA: glycosyltransferase family 4 protein [Gemmatimonadaceae bacterium]|nr:glycosyltransferase family 4 protein [Gemmatimonadaceae bacterium]